MTNNPDGLMTMQGLVKGTVQGVFFRASTQRQAEQLGIGGWVRNTADGHVEVCISGDAGKIAEMLVWLHQGPMRAKVTDVGLTPIECPPIHGFTIRR